MTVHCCVFSSKKKNKTIDIAAESSRPRFLGGLLLAPVEACPQLKVTG